jgi:3-mercaptopyruvate sulfurtransferase SseA
VYYLQRAGFTKVMHVSGGLSEWVRQGLPMAGEDGDSESGPSDGGDGSDGREQGGALAVIGSGLARLTTRGM